MPSKHTWWSNSSQLCGRLAVGAPTGGGRGGHQVLTDVRHPLHLLSELLHHGVISSTIHWHLRASLNLRIQVQNNVCGLLLLFVSCLTSQQHASVSQGRICSDNSTCCHTETEVADQTFHLTQSQYTDTGPTSPSTDPIRPGTLLVSHWSANF